MGPVIGLRALSYSKTTTQSNVETHLKPISHTPFPYIEQSTSPPLIHLWGVVSILSWTAADAAHAPSFHRASMLWEQFKRGREPSLLLGLLAEMHGAERQRNAKHKAEAQPSTMKDGKVKCDTIPERVTLKKEIGLLSACTIIIGELTHVQKFYITL